MIPGEFNTTVNYNVTASGELTEWLTGLSSHLQLQPENNRIEYPETFASGFAKVYDIEPGLSYR
ncbi:MAG: hypothetical protein ABI472_16690, partial [Ginsengibacter sp.]